MSTTSFTPKEICEIILLCSNSGVIEFNYDNFRIVFQARKIDGEEELQSQSPGPVTAIPEDAFNSSIITQDELSVKDDELSLMQIEDPLGYENMLVQRELEP